MEWTIELIILVCLVLFGFALSAVLFGKLSRLQKQLAHLVDELKLSDDDLAQSHQSLRHEFEEDRTRNLAIGRKIRELSEQVDGFGHRVDDMAMQDPDTRLYSKASELVKSGATVEELMQACDLPRAEAELIANLYRK